MPRTISAPALARLLAAEKDIHYRAWFENPDGAMVNVTDLLGTDWLDAGKVGDDVDRPVMSATVILRLDTDEASMSPHMGGSLINRDAAEAFKPFLELNRDVVLEVAVTAPGVAPIEDDWHGLGEYVIDSIDPAANDEYTEVIIELRDIGARVLDRELVIEHSEGSPTGEPVLDVISGILTTAGLAAVAGAIETPDGEPDALVPAYTVPKKSTLLAIHELVHKTPFEFRYRYNAADEFVPQLYEPARGNDVADWTLTTDQFYKLTELKTSIADVRNLVVVEYLNRATGVRGSVTAENATSRAKYEDRFMEIIEADTSIIDSPEEAQELADLGVNDLGEPWATHRCVMPLFWPVQTGDVIEFPANDVLYDDPQKFAVVGYEHDLAEADGVTTLLLRGTVTGSWKRWLRSTGGLANPVSGQTETTVEMTASDDVSVSFRVRTKGGAGDNVGNIELLRLAGSATLISGPALGVDASSGQVWQFARGAALDGVSTPDGLATFRGFQSGFQPSEKDVVIPAQEKLGVPSVIVRELTATTREVTLSIRPTSAEIYWRLDETGAFTKATGGTTTLDPIDVVTDRVLEYYGRLASGAISETKRLVIDADADPEGTINLDQTGTQTATLSMNPDEDVVLIRAWANRGAWPTVDGTEGGTPDEDLLIHEGGPHKRTIEFIASGVGTDPASRWYVKARFYDKHGNYGEVTTSKVMVAAPPAVPVLFDFIGTSHISGSNRYNDILWSHNDEVQVPTLTSVYHVSIYEDDGSGPVLVTSARDARTEHDGGGASANVGGFHVVHAGANEGDPGAVQRTYYYTVELRRQDTTLVATYGPIPVTSWYQSGGEGGGGAPTLQPDDLVLTPSGYAGLAEWTNPDVVNPITIEWYQGSAFAGPFTLKASRNLGVNDTDDSQPLLGGGSIYAYFRARYYNGYGVGPWSTSAVEEIVA